MAINFPDSPTLNQEFTVNSRIWKWDGSAWRIITASLGPTGPQGPTGADGPQGDKGDKGDTGLGFVGVTASSTELNYSVGVTSAIQTQLNTKAPLAAPTFTGTVVLPSTTSIGNVSATEIGYLDGVTSAVQTQINAKAPLDSPTFTGTVGGITQTMVGLGSVDNTADTAKPVSTAQQTALNLKANLAAPTFTGTVVLPSTTSIGLVSSAELGYLDGVTSAIQTQLDTKLSTSTASSTYAPIAAPTFTGTVVLPSTTSIGNVSATEIGYVDGVTSAIQTQLDAKLASATAATTYAPIANATLTGTVVLPSTTSIGNVSATEIGYVDGVTSAIQTQLDAKSPLASPTFTGTLTSSDVVINGALKVTQATKEKVYTTATGFAGYTYYFVTNGAIQYITGNSSGDGTVNIRPSSSVTTDSFLAIGESVTVILQITNGTAYRPTAWQIDGSAVTPKWQGGTPPTAGNASSIDIYSITIIKTASATYTVLASQTKFA